MFIAREEPEAMPRSVNRIFRAQPVERGDRIVFELIGVEIGLENPGRRCRSHVALVDQLAEVDGK